MKLAAIIALAQELDAIILAPVVVLPTECIENVLVYLSPKHRFCVATDFRFLYIQKMCLPVLDYASAFHASRKGQCDLLDKYSIHRSTVYGFQARINGIYCDNTTCHNAMAIASEFGHVAVLQWWEKKGALHDYTPSFQALVSASANGHLDVLQWHCDWYSALHKHDETAFQTLVGTSDNIVDAIVAHAVKKAARNGHVAVLQWWMPWWMSWWKSTTRYAAQRWLWNSFDVQSPLSCSTLIDVSAKGHVSVLQWWKDVCDTLNVSLEWTRPYEQPILAAAQNGCVVVLQWWHDFLGNEKFIKCCKGKNIVVEASTNGYIAVLEWWKDVNGLSKYYNVAAVNAASRYGHVAILQWFWEQHATGVKYVDLELASANGHIAVLQWYRQTIGLSVSKTRCRGCMEAAKRNGHHGVVQWLKAVAF